MLRDHGWKRTILSVRLKSWFGHWYSVHIQWFQTYRYWSCAVAANRPSGISVNWLLLRCLSDQDAKWKYELTAHTKKTERTWAELRYSLIEVHIIIACMCDQFWDISKHSVHVGRIMPDYRTICLQDINHPIQLYINPKYHRKLSYTNIVVFLKYLAMTPPLEKNPSLNVMLRDHGWKRTILSVRLKSWFGHWYSFILYTSCGVRLTHAGVVL